MVNYSESSIKITETDIQTKRKSIGFFPHEVSNVAEFILETVGPEFFQILTTHFRDEIYNPNPNSLLMIGHDGSGFEFYVEYGNVIVSYDVGKNTEFVYHNIMDGQREFVYGYLARILPEDVVGALNHIVPIEKCSHLWLKNSPHHKFVYLFKINEGVPVPEVKAELQKAARCINPDDIQMDDALHVVLLALAVTSAGELQMAIYFRDLTSSAVAVPSFEDS